MTAVEMDGGFRVGQLVRLADDDARRPRRALMVGPGNWPLKPQIVVLRPGRISTTAGRIVIS